MKEKTYIIVEVDTWGEWLKIISSGLTKDATKIIYSRLVKKYPNRKYKIRVI